MTYRPLHVHDKLHLEFEPGGRPDVPAARAAMHTLIDADWEAVRAGERHADDFTQARDAAELRRIVDAAFADLEAAVAPADPDPYWVHLSHLSDRDVWTFYTTHGAGEDECGTLLWLLADTLGWPSVRAALGGTLTTQ